MQPAMILPHLALLAAIGLGAGPLQDGSSSLGKLPPAPKGLKPSTLPLASDGKRVEPGRIPTDASPRARELWQKIVNATGGASKDPLTGFDLQFDVEVRTDSGTNSLGLAQYSFWSEKGFIRSEWTKSGRVQLRGPLGDWLIDKDTKTELIGRENVQSRRELSQWAAISRNFLAIATPASMRIVALGEVKDLRVAFPTGTLAELAGKLEWLEVRSPDFGLVTADEPSANTVYRAYLGQNPATGEVELAVLQEDDARRPVEESTLLVEIQNWAALGTRHVPQRLRVYRTLRKGIRWALEQRPNADLFLKKNGVLNPTFKPEHFLP